MSWKIVKRGTRLAIVAGILVAIGGVAVFMAISSAPPSEPAPQENNGNTTNNEPRQITIDLNENLNVGVE